jgi:hypothetical protein
MNLESSQIPNPEVDESEFRLVWAETAKKFQKAKIKFGEFTDGFLDRLKPSRKNTIIYSLLAMGIITLACGSTATNAREFAIENPDDPSAQQAAEVEQQNNSFLATQTAQTTEKQNTDNSTEPNPEIINSNISNFTIPEGYAGTLSNIIYDELNCRGGAYLVLLVRLGNSGPDTAKFFDNGQIANHTSQVFFEPGARVYLGEEDTERSALIAQARKDGFNIP